MAAPVGGGDGIDVSGGWIDVGVLEASVNGGLVLTELRFAWRRLRRRPWRSFGTALTLAIGIGATTAAFAAVDGVLLHDLPVDRQEELVVAWQASERTSIELPFGGLAFDALTRGAGSLESLAGYSAWGALPTLVDTPSGSHELNASYVAGDFFGVLRARPTRGRLLSASDDEPGAVPVAVVSHSAWRTRYGADPGIVGSTLVIGDRTVTIVGVGPRGFDYPRGTDFWYPLRHDYADRDADVSELHLIGRMAPGVDRETVVEDIGATLAADGRAGTFMPDARSVVVSLEERVVGAVRPLLEAAFLAAALLLLVAGANAVLLLLADGVTATHDTAVRLALGADRSHLTHRMLADAASVGLLACAGGWLLASGALAVLVPGAPVSLPRFDGVSVGWRASAFAVAASVVLATAAGLVAGLLHSRGGLRTALFGGGTRVVRGTAFRRTIAAVQVGLTVVSSTGAGLLVRTVVNLDALDPGFSATDMAVVSLRLPYPWFDVPERYFTALDEVVADLERQPGVVAVRPTLGPPLQQRLEVRLRAANQTDEEFGNNPAVAVDAVMPGHFEAMGIAIRSGRGIAEADNRPDADPVVVVDAALGDALWPGRDPIGQRLVGYPGRDEMVFTVVGVAAATRYRELIAVHPRAYYPVRLLANSPPSALLVRTVDRAVPVRDLVARALASYDPSVRIVSTRRMTDVLRDSTAGRRFAATVLLSFAGATLLLASLGVFTVFTALVGERRREMGLRRAVGAQRATIARMVLGGIVVVPAAGAAVGSLVAVWAGHLVESLLFGVAPADPVTLVAVVIGSLTVAVCAGIVPAVRAASIDPAITLRGG